MTHSEEQLKLSDSEDGEADYTVNLLNMDINLKTRKGFLLDRSTGEKL